MALRQQPRVWAGGMIERHRRRGEVLIAARLAAAARAWLRITLSMASRFAA
jgi:hypothetical protein